MRSLFLMCLTTCAIAAPGSDENVGQNNQAVQMAPSLQTSAPCAGADSSWIDGGSVGAKASEWSQTGDLYTLDGNRSVSLQVPFPPNDKAVHTVVFAYHPPVGPLLNDNAAFPVAQIDWMIGGSEVTRIINVVDGSTISGVGERVKVTIKDATPAGDPTLQTPNLKYTVTASVATGTRGSTSLPPTYTPPALKAYYLISGADVDVDIPIVNGINAGITSVQVLAGLNSIAVGVGDATSVIVTQISKAGDILKRYDAISHPNFVPIHPLCTVINVHNANAAIVQASVVFGVDG